MNHSPQKAGSRIAIWSGLFLIFALLLSACQPTPAPTQPPAPPTAAPVPTATPEPQPVAPPVDLGPQLVDRLWTLVAYGEAANLVVVEEGSLITALFSSDGTLSGSGSCNNYTSTYELDGDQLAITSPIASTMMFCETGMAQESTYLASLQKAARLAFTAEGRLEVFYDTGIAAEHKLVFVPGETPLEDTVWVLQAMGDPNNPSEIERGTIVTAIFSPEGNLGGTSGCNNYVAGYTLHDDQLKVQQAVSTLMACPQGMEQEAAFLAALEGAETYRIAGADLQISYDGGAGVLAFTARNLPLENVLWTLVAMNGERNTAGQVPTTLLFDPGPEPGQGSAGGVAMCNNYHGGYTLEQDQLILNALASTRMSCPQPVMQAEATYLELLEKSQTYQVFGQTLIITSEKGLLTYVANRAPLEGTSWRLTALGAVDNPQAPVAGADFTALFLRQAGVPSGLVLGGTGCNDYNAVYAASLEEIKINVPLKTNNTDCAAGLTEQEWQYGQALNAATSYRILGDTLNIFYGDNGMLSYTAFVPELAPVSGGPLSAFNGTRWWLVSMRNVLLRPGSTITADFAINADGETGAISGTAGCNNYNAPILGYFQVGQASSGMMTCTEPEGVMEQEATYRALLSTANRISQVNNQLVIGTAGGLLVYYNQPVPSVPIVPPATPTPEQPAATATPEPTLPPPTATPPPAEPPTATPTVEAVPPIATAPSQLPQAVISAPESAKAGKVVIFDATHSSPQGWLASYTWNFGDGTLSEGVLAEHVFGAPGVYSVTLTVVDFYGQSSVAKVTITIY